MAKKVSITFLRSAALIPICTIAFSTSAGCPDGKIYDVHLTFDDGPHPTRSPKVLDALKKEQVPATFFVMGKLIQQNYPIKNKDVILNRIRSEGHTLASHTYDHKSHTCGGRLAPAFSPAEAKKDLERARGGMDSLFTSNLFRFPYGRGWLYEPACPGARVPVMEHAHKLGMEHLGWDIDSQDYMTNPPFFKPGASIIPGILKQICQSKGGVILFHDINPWTSRNLGKVIRAIKDAGHRLTTLDKISKDHDSFNQAPGGAHTELENPHGETVVK